MFVSNATVDVYRDTAQNQEYSEYSDAPEVKLTLVHTNVPIHLTPFRPTYSETSGESWQNTQFIANTRLNYVLRRHDELRTSSGRVFVVDTVEGTPGAFSKNSIVYRLTENTPVV